MDYNEFENRLQKLISEARKDDISIVGTTDARTSDPSEPDYTIEVTRVASKTEPTND